MKLNRLLRLTAFTCSWCLIYVSISSTWAQALDSSTIEKLQKETETMLADYKKMPPSDPKRKALGEKINQNMQLLPFLQAVLETARYITGERIIAFLPGIERV